jgi:large subunit ribosomal protein L13
MKTYSAKPGDITRAWYEINASEVPLGRLATKVAVLLTGKSKPQFTPHIDCGDYVVVVNADKLITTGDKLTKKSYYRHSGYAGGLRKRTLAEQLGKDSTEVIYRAVRGMLPINKLRDARLARLKIYSGPEHRHEAQKPSQLSLKKEKS